MDNNKQTDQIVFTARTATDVEKGLDFAPKLDANGLIAAMAVDHVTREPLMLAYMNEESLKMTLALGEAVYYSRSRQEIWHKGATSCHVGSTPDNIFRDSAMIPPQPVSRYHGFSFFSASALNYFS